MDGVEQLVQDLNITRLECKRSPGTEPRGWQHHLNITRLECKVSKSMVTAVIDNYLNITRLECKVILDLIEFNWDMI